MKKVIFSAIFCATLCASVQQATAQNVMVTEHFRIGDGIEVNLNSLEIQRLLDLKGVRYVDFDNRSQYLTLVYELGKNDFEEVRARVKTVFTTNINAQTVQNMARENNGTQKRTR